MKSLQKLKNNKGMSLVEVIIAVAIISIVLATVMAFMVAGTKLFGRSNNQIEMQEQAQLTLNNIENRIIDAQLGATFSDSGNYHILTIMNNSDKEYIFWVEGTNTDHDNKIFYDTSGTSDTKDATNLSLNEVLAKNVYKFKVVLNTIAGDLPKADVELEMMDKTGRTANSNKTISFRNNIATNVSSQDQLYVDAGDAHQVEAREVVLSPDNATVIAPSDSGASASYKFNARVKGIGYPSQLVTWSLVGQTLGATIDENTGDISIPGGSGGTITVQAKAAGTEIVGTASLQIISLDSISVTAPNVSVDSDGHEIIYAGTMLQLKAEVNAAGGVALPENMKAVEFSVVGYKQGIQLYSDSGLFGLGAEAKGKTYTVRATSRYDSSKFGDFTFTVQNTSLTESSGSAVVDRGGSTELVTNLVGENLAASELNIQWSITDDAGLGNRISVNSQGVFTASKDINYENEYLVEVKARVTAGRLSSPVDSMIKVRIPKVSLQFEHEEGTVDIGKNDSVKLNLKATGLVLSASDISVATNPSLSNCIVYPTNDGIQLSVGSNNQATSFDVIATLKNTHISAVQGIRIQ